MIIRPEVMKFARAMEKKLRENDHKGGWEKCSEEYLIGRIKDETSELESALTMQAVTSECVDIANFAMMISENFGAT